MFSENFTIKILKKFIRNPIFIRELQGDFNFAAPNLSQYLVLALKSYSENFRLISRAKPEKN
jgi:hypothetical protein